MDSRLKQYNLYNELKNKQTCRDLKEEEEKKKKKT